jgi:diguanylate cyclase (GGDEF)-like protein
MPPRSFKPGGKSVDSCAMTGPRLRHDRDGSAPAAAVFGGRPDLTNPATTGPGAPSRVTAALLRLADVRPATILLASLFAVATVGLADSRTGHDLSLSIFYILPPLIATTKGRRLGLVVAATASGIWFLADLATRDEPYSSIGVPIWNVMMRFVVIVLVVALVDALLGSALHERQLARRDHLTGLQNSRAFSDSAEAELRGSARTGRPLTLAYIDIDRFKTVNDLLGHAAGDAVLVGTGHVLALATRQVDTVARVGGDEFMVLLPETDADQAQVALGRVHGDLVEAATRHGWDVGYSVGAVTFTSPPDSIEAMVARADQLMYEVKQHDKGTIRFSAA